MAAMEPTAAMETANIPAAETASIATAIPARVSTTVIMVVSTTVAIVARTTVVARMAIVTGAVAVPARVAVVTVVPRASADEDAAARAHLCALGVVVASDLMLQVASAEGVRDLAIAVLAERVFETLRRMGA